MMIDDWQNPGNDIPMLSMITPNTPGNPSAVAIPSNTTVEIMLDIGHNIEFDNVWDRVKLFMHINFGNTIKNGIVSEVNESYQKLVKKYPLLYDNFEL
jgi:hypothetical protein